MHQTKFICFIGIDGSGKTTLAKRITDELNKKGGNYIYVHSLIEPMLLKPFMTLGRALLVKGKSREKDYCGFSKVKREKFSKYRFVFSFYAIMLFLDYLPQIIRKIVIPLLRGKKIVSDRYLYDTLINLGLNRNYNVLKLKKLINNFFVIFPKPDITFLIDVPEEVAFSRKDDVPTIEYLKERRPLYIGLAQLMNIPVLDGTKSVEELTFEVMENIKEFNK